MITSRVTPPVEEEGVEVDGAEGVGGAAVPVVSNVAAPRSI